MTPRRLVFLGTAELACPSLEALAQTSGLDIVGVVTRPDRPKGRNLKSQPPPVKTIALALGLPLFQPERIRHETALATVAAWQPDLLVVVAYGQILPPALLAVPRFGCLNVHASLLPKYRGAAPIQGALLDNRTETGVTIMQMDAGLDTGPIISQATIPIQPEDNAQTLHDRLAERGARLLIETLPAYFEGALPPRPQPADGVSHAPKISKADGQLDWALPAQALWNRVRALTPWPGTFTYQPAVPAPLLLKIWAAKVVPGRPGNPGQILQADSTGLVVACGQDALEIEILQREGKRRLPASEFLAGHPLPVGLILGMTGT